MGLWDTLGLFEWQKPVTAEKSDNAALGKTVADTEDEELRTTCAYG